MLYQKYMLRIIWVKYSINGIINHYEIDLVDAIQIAIQIHCNKFMKH